MGAGHAPLFTNIETLAADRASSGRRYHEFLQIPDLSAGVYRLEVGAEDTQSPHAEDEIYVVLRGQARFRAGDADGAIGPGSVLFVPARMEHRFHSIRESLDVLVVFGPAEGTRR
jgi:mannose-6-phosphate isomerase-like protein (cupin superfamily)